jgi:adenine-specific DNA-methyltransferase
MSTLSGVKTTHREKTIIKEKETLLVYAKNKQKLSIKPQYTPTKEWDQEFQYYLNRNNSTDESKWTIEKLNDVLDRNGVIKKDLTDKKFIDFISKHKNSIWRRAFIRNKYKELSQKEPNRIFKILDGDFEHLYYRGRELFFLNDKYNVCFTEEGFKNEMSILLGDIWNDINTGKLFNEGGVEFRNGKKPEFLIARLIDMFTSPGDIVLDSFLGSGTTSAVAHKMGRRWIGIEMGDHAYTLCKVRLDKVIDGTDQGGISKAVNWKGGGGYRFYELAPTLIKKDSFGQEIINPEYNAEMLASAVAKHEGYVFNPHENIYWKQSKTNENSYLFVTTRHLSRELMESISQSMAEGEYLLIVCRSYDATAEKSFKNIKVKKIPQSLLKNCEFDVDNYNLNIVNPPVYQEDVMEDDYTVEGGNNID